AYYLSASLVGSEMCIRVRLDIGCGTGKMYEAAEKRKSARTARKGDAQNGQCFISGNKSRDSFHISEFVFTDISEKMLDTARLRFPASDGKGTGVSSKKMFPGAESRRLFLRI
ncbi:MAG: class I SAM-dependent methyltransferase, partial [Schaedlerella sp.]|uniref:class I SAM-dependent methyltransferase n=1 Tax=Schaedlerella sp. TaxID=2676057 RepID=UPI0035295A5C